MVNINIEIPDDLHKKMKIKSVMEEKTLKDHIIEELNTYVRKHGKP